MPSAPPRACRCGALIPAGKRCLRCTKAADKVRGSAASRGYDAEWRAFREDFLRRYPWCSIEGCPEPATDVDHIVALRDGGKRFDPANCRPMCHPHHSARTIADRGANRGKGVRR
jgi:5-methylcytosine-specific restriction protein A